MNLLLDTHILLWALDEPSRLKPDMRALLEDSGNEVFFSAASIWEIAVKARPGATHETTLRIYLLTHAFDPVFN